MTRSTKGRGAVALIAVAASGLALAMCGMAPEPRYAHAPPPPAAENPSPQPTEANGMAAAPAPAPAPAPGEQESSAATRAPEAEPPSSSQATSQERRAARADFDRARGDLEAAVNDCALACKALASMERAVVRLCSLAELPDDRRRCEDVKKRLLDARDRVRTACGGCPGGPSVRRGDPIPTP